MNVFQKVDPIGIRKDVRWEQFVIMENGSQKFLRGDVGEKLEGIDVDPDADNFPELVGRIANDGNGFASVLSDFVA